jgi:hypothetical protein
LVPDLTLAPAWFLYAFSVNNLPVRAAQPSGKKVHFGGGHAARRGRHKYRTTPPPYKTLALGSLRFVENNGQNWVYFVISRGGFADPCR